MSPNTAVPRELRLAEPAPLASTKGNNAKAVIGIGRSLVLQAKIKDSNNSATACHLSLANCTIRMAFLAAWPINMINTI